MYASPSFCMNHLPQEPPVSLPRAGLSTRCRELYRTVWQRLRGGDLEAAVSTCRTLNEEFPRFEEGWYLRSVVASRLGNWQKALDFVERALRFKKENLLFLCQKANCLVHVGRPLEGRALVEAVAAHDPEDAVVLAGVGTVFAACGEHEKAMTLYKQAVAKRPNNSLTLFNLAATQKALGDREGAEASYDAGLALNPHGYEAYLIRSDLRTQTPDRNHTTEMEQLLAEGVGSWRGEARLCYALAKEYGDLADHARSFEYAVRGARLKRAHLKYHVGKDIKAIEEIIGTFDRSFFGKNEIGFQSHAPIFIVGLPFSGAPLLERMLAGHSEISSGGERNDFPRQVMKLVARGDGSSRPRPELIPRAVSLKPGLLGENYVKAAGAQLGGATRFTDSLPLNYLYLGLIAVALPRASLVEVVSHPMSTCYSLFTTLFKRAYPFSYDLKELGQYYVAYRRLMDHWHAMLPDRLITVQYEALLRSGEQEARRVLDFCGLPWDSECLGARAESVRIGRARHVPADALTDRWRDYTQQLRPLADVLAENGISVMEDQ